VVKYYLKSGSHVPGIHRERLIGTMETSVRKGSNMLEIRTRIYKVQVYRVTIASGCWLELN
jgi:hypothetical protein